MLSYARRYLDEREVDRRWLDPRLSSLRLTQIRSYLLSRGWQPVPPDRPHVLVFREPTATEDGPLYQWVPDSEKERDYLARVYEVLAAVAEVEDRYAGDVLTEMLRQPVTETVSVNGPATPSSGEPAAR
jgi:hypothetical protein